MLKVTDKFFRNTKKHNFAKLTSDLAAKEIIFNAPPLTKEMVKAINLISPQYVLQLDEESRIFWENEQNACCWGEYDVFYEYLLKIPKPEKCLEIGPGMGRSTVFFIKKLNLTETEFHLYESSGTKTKYTIDGPRFTDSFCGTIEILKEILKYNDVQNYKIFKSEDLNYRLDNLSGPYDVIYCLYGIGFHWGLEYFIDEIFTLMHESTLAFFLVCDNFKPFAKLKNINYKIVEYVAAYPANKINRMLVMSKSRIW